MKKVFLVILFVVGNSLSLFAQTSISNNSSISGIWTVENSPYIIEGSVLVANGATLTIEPGVEVRLKSSASSTPSWFDFGSGNVGTIRVQGEIIANGTVDDPILFTRNNTGFWGTILIDENASGSCSFTNCIIEYAKESRNISGISSPTTFNGGISVYKSSITINHNEFRNNNINGIYVREVTNAFSFSNNIFHDNGANGSVIELSTVHVVNNTFYNNSNAASGQVSAIRSTSSTNFLIGNLIYNNDDFGIFTSDGGNHFLVNNTIFGNNQGLRVESGANTFIYNTIFQNNTINFATSNPGGAMIEIQHSATNDATLPNNVTNVAGNLLSSNVLFTNSGANNFSLQSNSPAIDAGSPLTTGLNLPELDLLGNMRIDNNTIDIGAIEFQQQLAIDDHKNLSDLMIYPNPTNSILNVVYEEGLFISIYSLDGKELNTFNSKEIDLTNYSQGVYVLKFENGAGHITTRRVVKN